MDHVEYEQAHFKNESEKDTESINSTERSSGEKLPYFQQPLQVVLYEYGRKIR